MLNIALICVGKLKESYLREAAAEYQKRLSAFCRLEITELSPCKLPENPSPAQVEAALIQEGGQIMAKIPSNAKVYALCIEGKQLSSGELSAKLVTETNRGVSNITLIIGGSHGLSEDVKKRADLMLSMSKMTFPHQLARIMLLEQLYRAGMISNGGKYHK
ncbi:MAG: 23S rRNA (pseudouridine(1915)-N(3))-methyltransferase RlmH [Eubacteriales bacterium]